MLEHKTVFTVQAALLLLLGGVIFYAFRRDRRLRNDGSAPWLAAAYLTSGLGLALIAIELGPHAQANTIVGNGLLLLFPALASRALAEATGQRSRAHYYLFAFAAATLANFAWFTYAQPNWLLRSWESGIATAILYGPIIALLLRSKEEVTRPATRMMAALFAVHIVVSIIRLIVWRYTHTLVWFSGMNLVSSGGLALAYLWMDTLRNRETMERTAMTDPLTGLYNRRAMAVIAAREVREAVRAGAPCSALMMDIDRFKEINDAQGHVAGDATLIAIASAIQSVSDIGMRFGGDEFFVLLPDADEAAAELVASRIRVAIATLPLQSLTGQIFTPTVSIGSATLRGPATTIDDLIHASDITLYQQKQGRPKHTPQERPLEEHTSGSVSYPTH